MANFLHYNVGNGILEGEILPPRVPPAPTFDDCVWSAGYLLGNAHAERWISPEALDYGAAYDYSRHGNHLTTLGSKVFDDYGMTTSTGTSAPLTPFTLDEFLDGSEDTISIAMLMQTIATDKAVNAVRSLNVDPFISLQVQPQTSGGRAQAIIDEGDPVTTASTTGGMAAMFGKTALFVATFSDTLKTVRVFAPDGTYIEGTNSDADNVTGGNVFHFGVATGSGTDSIMRSVDFFKGIPLSVERARLLYAYKDIWFQAIESGVPIITGA